MGVAEVCMLVVLAGFAGYDIKTKRVPAPAIGVFGVLVAIYRLCAGTELLMLAAGLVPGLVLLLLAYITKESIGTGDGLVLCIIGMFYGWKKTVVILGMALVLSAVLAMLLLVLRRAGRKTELPFLPCLFSGCLLCLFLMKG